MELFFCLFIANVYKKLLIFVFWSYILYLYWTLKFTHLKKPLHVESQVTCSELSPIFPGATGFGHIDQLLVPRWFMLLPAYRLLCLLFPMARRGIPIIWLILFSSLQLRCQSVPLVQSGCLSHIITEHSTCLFWELLSHYIKIDCLSSHVLIRHVLRSDEVKGCVCPIYGSIARFWPSGGM